MDLGTYLANLNSRMESYFIGNNIPNSVEMIKRSFKITRANEWIPDEEITFDGLCEKLFETLNPKFDASREYIAFGIMFTGMSSGLFKINSDSETYREFIDRIFGRIEVTLTKIQNNTSIDSEDRFWLNHLLVGTFVDINSATALPIHKKCYGKLIGKFGPEEEDY